jgi:hypothetical protein
MEDDDTKVTTSNARFDEWYEELHPQSTDDDVDECEEDDYSENDYE